MRSQPMVPSSNRSTTRDMMGLPTTSSKMANAFERELLRIIFLGWTVRLFGLQVFFIKFKQCILSSNMQE